MTINKFQGKTEEEALEKAKSDLLHTSGAGNGLGGHGDENWTFGAVIANQQLQIGIRLMIERFQLFTQPL